MTYKLAGEVNIPVGTPVKMTIDAYLRDCHAKVHSAGHLIDLAVERLSIFIDIQSMSGLQARDIISLMVHTWSTRERLRILKKQ